MDSKYEIDSVKNAKQYDHRRGFEILMEAQAYWDNMARFRRERERNRNYCYGRQWEDYITVDGETMTEKEYIQRQGNVPLVNNLIRRLLRNVLGVYRSQSKEPTCTARDRDEQKLGETMSTILQCNMQINGRKEIDSRSMEDFLIGGLIVHRKWYGWRENKLDCWTDYINPNNFFIDSNMRDFRGWDATCLGEIHDISFGELVQRFAKSASDYKKLADIYRQARDRGCLLNQCEDFGYNRRENYDFLYTADPTRCRVIEVWRKETKPRYRCHDLLTGQLYKIEYRDKNFLVDAENDRRIAQCVNAGLDPSEAKLIEATWFVDNLWYYYMLSPFGHILEEGETPYAHRSHPYVFKAYPFIDGEIHSFVGDVVDQQRYTNRLITLYDWIMRASAKGVLLFPQECLPEGVSLEDIADEWSRFNGVIAIKAKPGQALPQQISNNATNIGISELLSMQLKFFEDISGVQGALQGKPGYSGTSGSLYSQQTQNATTSLVDLLDSFSAFIVDGAYKDVKNIQQFYDEKRRFNIVGRAGEIVEYDPEQIKDVEFDLSIVESTSTPAYRAIANEFLMQIWQTGAISLEQMLEHGSFPFGDELLQSIKAKQEEAQTQQAQAMLGADPNAEPGADGESEEQAPSQPDPRALAMLQQYMSQQTPSLDTTPIPRD